MTLPIVLLTLASLASLAAWIWLVTVAFQSGQKNWAIALIVSVFVPVVGLFVPIVFIIQHWRIARPPALLFLGSMCVGLLGFVLVLNSVRQVAETMADDARLQMALQNATVDQEPIPETPVTHDEPPTPEPTSPRPMTPAHRPVPAPPRTPRPPSPSASPAASPKVDSPDAPPSPPLTEPPVVVETLEVGEPSPNQLRTLRIRAGNRASKPVREARLSLTYLDARGRQLGHWTTTHSDATHLLDAQTTNEFKVQAFFVPQFTRKVRVEVESIRFADESRWPPRDSTLVDPRD